MEEKKSGLVENITLTRVPMDQRKPWISIAFIWAGSVICIPALMVGSFISAGMNFAQSALCMVIGYSIVVVYMCLMGIQSADLGLPSTVAISRAYGKKGSSFLVSLVLVLCMVGWFAAQTSLCAMSFCGIMKGYGGMSGRDIMALTAGLYESCNVSYLEHRIKQCEYLAEGFFKAGVKGVVLPAGGHGVYINMDEFFDGRRSHESFAGQGFSIELIRRYGIRTAELGDYSMEYDLKTPEQQAEVCNVVRFAVNRSQLSREHLDYVIAAVKALYEDRESIPNVRIVAGRELPMRHFHAFLEPYFDERD